MKHLFTLQIITFKNMVHVRYRDYLIMGYMARCFISDSISNSIFSSVVTIALIAIL
jgi:hypothetical protein